MKQVILLAAAVPLAGMAVAQPRAEARPAQPTTPPGREAEFDPTVQLRRR